MTNYVVRGPINTISLLRPTVSKFYVGTDDTSNVKLLEEALTQSSRLSDLAIHSRHHGPISNNGYFTATDAFSSDRMLAIRGVLAGLYS